MKKIIFVDDDHHYLKALEENIQLRAPEFTVVQKITNPAAGGNVEGGELVRYLANESGLFDDGPIIIVLDIRFGDDSMRRRLGVKIARYLLSSNWSSQVKIIAVTGENDQLLFDDLVEIGVEHIVQKTNLAHFLAPALKNIKLGKPFLGDITVLPNETGNDVLLQNEIAREVARGYRNNALEAQGYDAVGVHKNNFRKANFDSLPVSGIVGHRLPGPTEWNDVWYLLHHLKSRDRDIIDYVEKICGIRIEVPA
ncbi:response regulator [Neolewinella agarilytica]|uniref:DNA-binding response regulator, NarL/FixJ family, contains REC and HTH domains n=1 Tax=Neolewinella agarilytica TaxID=478744 RepID=A0A1H9DMT7_9BACT|nr:hypothetical protein [Neolewinella agarilytica]SEQ14794.1 DNA-binding response regulator, NarL/FixJ family, contains REC and HTH domains [Neolewinella agarilytica]